MIPRGYFTLLALALVGAGALELTPWAAIGLGVSILAIVALVQLGVIW